MVLRVCRELGTKKNIVVPNDESHHCYRRKPESKGDVLTGEAKSCDEDARIWISGFEAVKSKIGVKAIYDLSATPFFLSGSGYPECPLFPWVVSEFSLIDAIEAGIVKIPRVPVSDDSMTGDQPTYRDLWLRIREDLPKKGRKTNALTGEPNSLSNCKGRAKSIRQLQEVSLPVATEHRGPRQRCNATRVYSRLQQHQCLQTRLRLYWWLGKTDR
jgi:type III restriction enzyme